MATDKNKLIASAQRAAQKGQLDKAIELYRQIVDDDADDVRIWLKIADLYTKKGAVRQAIGTYARVAQHYSEKGFFLKAVAVYKNILRIDPAFVEANQRLAELYVKLGLAPEAIAQYQIVVGAYEREGRHRDSVELLERIVELAPEDVAARVRLAESHARQANSEAAVEEFRFALEILQGRHRLDEFVQVAERMLYFAPSDLETLTTLAEVYLKRGDPKRALARLQIVFKADPTNTDTLEVLARAFTGLGQRAKAISVYREMGRLHGDRGQPDKQYEAYQQILRIDPQDAEALAGVGGGSAHPPQMMSEALSINTGEFASTDDPSGVDEGGDPEASAESPERYLSDAEVYAKYQLVDKALEQIKKALAVDPAHEAALLLLRDLAVEQGQTSEAVEALLGLARATEADRPEEAMAYLGEVIQLEPAHPEATDWMRRLSSSMAAGLGAAPATPAAGAIALGAPPEAELDVDLDLGDIDFGSQVGALDLDAAPAAEIEGDIEIDLAGFDDDAGAIALTSESPGAIQLGGGEDDFGDLLADDAPVAPAEDDFGDLLGDDAPAAPAEDDFGDLLADDAPAAPAEDDFGDLLADDAPAAPAEDDFGDLLGDDAQPAPAEDDFGDLLADDAPAAPAEDDFGDLLADDAPAAPAEDDFGDLLGDDDPAEPAAPAIQLGPVDDPAADNYGDLLDAGTPESADSALPDGDDAFADLLGTPEDSAEAPAIAAEQSDAGFGDAAVGAGPDVSAPLPVGEDFDDLFSAAEAAVEAEEAEADRAGVAEQAGAETPQGTPRGSQPFPEEDFSDLLAGGAPAGAHPDDSGVGLVDDFASDGADAGGFDVGPPGDDTLGGDLATLAPGESDLPDFVEVAEPEAVLPPAGDLIDSALPEVPDASIAEALDDVDPFGADAPLTGNGSFEVADPANSVELEAEVSSLPGVDMGGPSSEGLLGAAPAAAIESGDDDLELLDDDDLELLDDDDLELIEDDEVGEATLAVGDLNAAELVAPSKGVDGLEVVADRDDDWGRTGARPVEAEERPAELPAEEAEPASEAWPDIADELEELDFLLDEKLFSDSHELVNDLKDSYGAHPQLLAAAERIAAAESAAAEDNLAGIAEDGGEPALLEGAHVDDLSDEDGAAFYDLGLAFKEMGQYGKAVEQLEKAARHRERRAEALRLIGLCELEQGHAANAIERFDQALRTPEISRDARVGLYYDLATAFEVQGNAERAQAQLQAIVDEGQPDFLDTQERLQRLSAANG